MREPTADERLTLALAFAELVNQRKHFVRPACGTKNLPASEFWPLWETYVHPYPLN